MKLSRFRFPDKEHLSTLGTCLCMLVLGVGCAVVHAEVSSSAPTSYAECVELGGKILKTYPGQCVASNGARFVDPSQVSKRDPAVVAGSAKKLCVDQCGNGSCQEMVCMAEGCPCAESPASCPQDCPS
jgi:hypothetical protein